ncbi:TetR/AcrR family transcriptional regulator [Acidithiobacillus sp. 'AMD consortium']|uniref:TetR/AcrR family transcriptional regulator n=1 Tax=Acidithiobacillus sp. 'AMD consortium' TaxID=2614801 RepID=UPI00124C212C|nr:TetR/AcrR family transcriptional regulator [Acidithiobacillus sp. 'AMD consortium']QFG79250.1 TetR/AcrR family transcriptional regulator [Acidithiobacillus sp. 'AMD consortium']
MERSVYYGVMDRHSNPALMDQTKLSARERILLTAHTLFYREGIRSTGVDRIIAEAGVTKVTFYRHFPSKNDLIVAFLDYRHRIWMSWFQDALQRHGNNLLAIAPVLQEWFTDPAFRGCAFINALGEMGGSMPEVVHRVSQHKAELRKVIEGLLPGNSDREDLASAVAMAIDGAVVRAEWGEPTEAIHVFNHLIEGMYCLKPQT